MKALIIEASTRAQGGTQAHIDALMSANIDWDFEQISLREIQLPAFVDHRVDSDWEFAAPTLTILRKMLAADLIILASPVYWFSVSHLAKNFLDFWTYFMRAELTPDRFFLKNKKVIPLLCATHTSGTEWAIGSIRASVEYVGGKILHEFLGIADRDGKPEAATIENIRKLKLSKII